MMHEASHIFATTDHDHSFFTDHEEIDYSSLEAMAGHSHEALEALKELLEANQQSNQDSEAALNFQFDKHLSIIADFEVKVFSICTIKKQWVYIPLQPKWCPNSFLPPPKSV